MYRKESTDASAPRPNASFAKRLADRGRLKRSTFGEKVSSEQGWGGPLTGGFSKLPSHQQFQNCLVDNWLSFGAGCYIPENWQLSGRVRTCRLQAVGGNLIRQVRVTTFERPLDQP